MTEPDSITLRHLQAIRATLAEHGDLLAQISVNMSAIGQQLGALTTAVYAGKSEMDSLKRRIERIERRLEISDAN